MTTPNGKTVGICGATGAVGIEIISVLAAHKFPVKQLVLFASSRSAGKKVDTPFGEVTISLFSIEKAAKLDYVFLAVSGDFSLQYAKELAAVPNGPVVIDNSSAFRRDPETPLVIPEINGHVLLQKDGGKPQPKLIANPNCTTAIAAMALWPLHCEFGIKKLIVSTYQAASGAGAAGMEELADGAKAFLADEPVTYKVFSYPLPFNLIPHIDKFQENGYTKEEMKVTWETRKIFGEPNLAVSCTAARIPIMRAHSEALSIETVKPVNIARAREILAKADGVDLVDEPEKLLYPMPKNATKKFNIEAGRLRKSLVFGDHGLELFVSGDQLLRGAALNAVLIAEFLENPRSTPQFTKKPTTCTLSKDQQQLVLGLAAGVAVGVASVLAFGLVKKN
ncbi:aspartate-semialdehyde dehydrogenase [Phytophthora nicotianae P10297]|uniref:aspartate-semialdehyde dehydrogenase n=4 Tax=Phytophthora nicotianae TaxID=4792 RepID=V9E699_PHYNI|nr:aspartate-semialdehyde dehydrogenase [Phytophthora nicotianae P1569]ETL80842.1 aspartate-semialdehyde dehydrogenase [Phytophthora nicotianae]ETO62633.1 aspartate-semialdehyde dehydrogenase [Phytophthora nicotianae P1976]ETP31855.1 aspartate-semialdehyde dehydrogenase [Phytophthora nicotianae P10297]KUF93022.1 ATP-binding Cassette (ABC) Superfamily [Phytophthora nicotianae]